MINFLLHSFLIVYGITAMAMEGSEKTKFIAGRSDELQLKINKAFDQLKESTSGHWYRNGSSHGYGLADIVEYRLLKGIINSNSDRKDFWFLDIGAGNFQLGRSLCRKLNKDQTIRNDVVVHLVSLRGEKNEGEERRIEGKCELIELGQFKVEDLQENLSKRGIKPEGGFDFIVSAWCFLHLCDAFGTFVEAYHALRPGCGFLVVDGFFVAVEGQGSYLPDCDLFALLNEISENILMQNLSADRSFFKYVLWRADNEKTELPLEYTGSFTDHGSKGQGPGVVTTFRFRDGKALIKWGCGFNPYDGMYDGNQGLIGSESLFKRLDSMDVWQRSWNNKEQPAKPKFFPVTFYDTKVVK